MVPSACKLFAGIDDPRIIGRTTHRLAEILFAALCATPCGFGRCDGYAQFAKAKVDVLRRYLPCKGGTPSHGTFGRLFRLVKPEQFEAVPADLARRVAAGPAGRVAIDGKAVRGSAGTRRGVPTLHLLHAFATDAGLCAGTVAVDGKSNETTALPDLLGLLDRRGRDVTMGALPPWPACAAPPGAARAFRPAALAHEGEALGTVHQAGKVDQGGRSHDGGDCSRASAITSGTRQRRHPDHRPGTKQEPNRFI